MAIKTDTAFPAVQKTAQKDVPMAVPKAVYKEYAIEVTTDCVYLPGGIAFKGKSLAAHLQGCNKCAVLAATLGAEVDRHLRRLQYTSLTAALEYDAKANNLIEEICDSLQEEIAVKAGQEGLHITSRFSPGYGDFPLSSQSDLLKITNAAALAGITVSDDNLLLPQKSVTAVIGYAAEKPEIKDKCLNCPIKEKCEKNEKC